MVRYLFEQNIIIYTFAGLCGLGLIVRFIVDLLYKRLVKESDNLGATKNKALKHMKMKFETCYKLKIGVNNVDTFVDKNVLRYRFCGILLSTWENFCGQVLFLSLLLVPVSAVFGVFYNSGQDVIMLTGAVGILASSIMIVVDKSMNLSAKKRLMKLNLMDYLENFLKVRLEQETFHPERLEQYRKEYFQAVETNKQISAAAAVQTHEEPKDELIRRREARQKKEEDKRTQALKREEEQKKIEEARKEEEKRKLEERKQLAAKRRQEELLKMEEEREALEARRAEAKRKAEERQQSNVKKLQQAMDKDRLLHSLEEDLKTSEDKDDMTTLMQGVEEIAAEKERSDRERMEKERKEKERTPKAVPAKTKSRSVNAQEEKLIEDVLKEFFA